MQVTNQMGDSKIETTKNIYGHLFAQDRALILKSIIRPSAVCTFWRTAETLLPDGTEIEKTPGDRAPGGRLVWDVEP